MIDLGSSMSSMNLAANFRRQILGISFFTGTVEEAVSRMREGGLLVVPAAPALKDIAVDEAYREALLEADMAIPDSGFMVLIWNAIEQYRMPRISGLTYLRRLLQEVEVQSPGNTFWIMADERSAKRNLDWLASESISVPRDYVYLAPVYGRKIEDSALIRILNQHRPKHIIVTLGGGTQERLGLYLRRNLDYMPSIHCIGAAIAFLSGDQIRIPTWADKLYVGWMLRCLSNPIRYVPRYWGARKLLSLLLRYRAELPPLRSEVH